VHVLVINSGSSSLKYGMFRVGANSAESLFERSSALADPPETLRHIASELVAAHLPMPEALGHRIVHGGHALRQHCVIDGLVLQQVRAATAFAPLHTPLALALIEHAAAHFPGLPQVACFDTSFHAELPAVARVLPLARELQLEGVQRYGFHGLSCESIVAQLATAPPARLIVAHLGSGASVTAIRDGKSIDTTMGLTPTGGLVMGTRSGDLDPGVLIYLLREKNFSASALETLLNRHSGLLGISGVASDMRSLRHVESTNADARLAIQMFCYSVCKQVTSMMTVLGGIDCLVFTGGIGEHDAEMRAEICDRLGWLGVRLDRARNRDALNPLSEPNSSCVVQVLAAQEELQIARHTAALVLAALMPARQASE
jgi:acetate kinase